MKTIAATFCAFMFALTLNAHDSINAIIGNQSIEHFTPVQQYGLTEKSRIQYHLKFVENELRKKDISGLSESARKNRTLRLNELREYWKKGVFPQPINPDKKVFTESRRPCFIDYEGRLCAVGYLVAQSTGLDVAESINTKHQFEYLMDMNDPGIDQWAEENGFTLVELAMIQPTYGWHEPIEYPITPDPGLGRLVGPVTYTINYGPSKKEIELQARLDSLQPAHDSVLMVLDSMTLRIEVLEKAMSEKEIVYQSERSEAEKKAEKSRSAIQSKQRIINGLSAGLAALFGLGVFQFIRSRKRPTS